MPPLTSKPSRMSYRIRRGERGVLTYEPYKSILLPHWRFRTVPIASVSATVLYSKFLDYYDEDDFIGMDMCRKFLQMGMTRAKRYANYKGGRKYARGGKEVVGKSEGHEGREEKEECSRVFREYLGRCRGHEGYKKCREEFLVEQRAWDRDSVRKKEEGGEGGG